MAKITLTPAKVRALSYAGQTVLFPIVGELTFSEEGTVEVDEEVMDDFIAATFESFGFYQKGHASSSVAENQSAEYAAIREQLAMLSTKDLLELARDSNLQEKYSVEQISAMTDGKLRQVLLECIVEQNRAGQQVKTPPAESETKVKKSSTKVETQSQDGQGEDEDFSSSDPEFTPPEQ